MKKRNALLSVFIKDVAFLMFAKSLVDLGFNIYSSGGTAKFLSDNGIEVIDIATLTGYPAILNHKVVTLATQIHAGLLAGKHELPELKKLGWPKFDLLCVTFYPLEEEMQKEGSTFESCLAKTDIGGPAMVRSAVKGGEVIVITDSEQMKFVIDWMNEGEAERDYFMRALRQEAEEAVAKYCIMSAEVHTLYGIGVAA